MNRRLFHIVPINENLKSQNFGIELVNQYYDKLNLEQFQHLTAKEPLKKYTT